MKNIQAPTLMSLQISLYYNDTCLSHASGFLGSSNGEIFLVTNRHNFTGRDQYTNEPLDKINSGIPNRVRIRHNSIFGLGLYEYKFEDLYLYDDPVWLEHPRFGKEIDVVCLRLVDTTNVNIISPLNHNGPSIHIQVSDIVSVIGYPFALSVENTAIWATGFIASEPDLDFNGLPSILIDCRTRKGQSGSLVVAFRSGGMVNHQDGSAAMYMGPVWNIIGIYSGRVNVQSDLGVVWRKDVISEIMTSGVPGCA